MTPAAYYRAVKQLLEGHRDPAQAAPMKAYLRDQFEYLGIKTPLRRALLKEFIAELS